MTKTVQNTKNIPMLDLKAQYLPLKDEIKSALKAIIESGRFVLGQNVRSFEEEVAAYHNVNSAVALASGTDALHLSLNALGITTGDEVITTPFTFVATAEAIAYVGAKPVFVDIRKDTLNIDTSKIEEKITPDTKAIIVVHLFGQSADMKEIMEIAKKHNLKVIEDCAQSFGAKYNGIAVGKIGDCGCFSFYPSKNLGAFGDGGMMITDNEEISNKVKLLRNHGTTGPYEHSFIGYNSRLDEIQAAILRIKLRHIDKYNSNRGKVAEIYTSVLGSAIQCPVELEDRSHIYHQYTLRSSTRDNIQASLKEQNIPSVVYYPLPLHLQTVFKYLGYSEGDLPESETVAKKVLSLPIYPELELDTAKYIAETVLRAIG